MRGGRRVGCLLVVLSLGYALAETARPIDASTSEELHRLLAVIRDGKGLSELEPSAAMRRFAEQRAGEIARAPVSRRLPHPVPFDEALEDWPGLSDMQLIERVVVVPLALTGAERTRAVWDNPEAGALALDAKSVAVGLGAWIAADGSLVMVALFRMGEQVAENITDRETIERLLFDEVNAIRVEHGFRALIPNRHLLKVARAHSETMLAGDYLGHESPDGSMPADRVRAAGIGFRLVGENVARSLRPLVAMHGVVQEWMDSPAHRANILTPDFHQTAMGAAVGEDGLFYVTQLFLER